MTLIRDSVLQSRERTINGMRIYTCLEHSRERVCVSVSKGQNIVALYVLDLPAAAYPEIHDPQNGVSPADLALEAVLEDMVRTDPTLLTVPF